MKRAVIIGVDEYRDPRIRNLEGARNDAQEIADLLAGSGEFEVADPLLGSRATGEAIRGAVSDLLWKVDELDLALLYFSGHAFDDSYGNGFLAPHDMEYDRPFVHGIRMQEINQLMLKAVNKDVVVVILDACKSGIAAGGQKGPGPQTGFEDAFGQVPPEAEIEGRGRVVLASSGPDEDSHERAACKHQYLGGDAHAHGAFTFQVLEALSGVAATDGVNVKLDDVRSFVERELKGQTLTFFGSGLQHSKEITLVRATAFESITKRLSEAEELFETGEPTSLFRAIRALAAVQPSIGNNDQANALRQRIDGRLNDERGSVSYYLTSRKMDLLDNCPTTCGSIEELLAVISFERLVGTEQAMLGLLVGLWEASQRPEDDGPYGSWLFQMKEFEKYVTASSRAQPKSQRPGRAA